MMARAEDYLVGKVPRLARKHMIWRITNGVTGIDGGFM